ncbi:WD40 repeat-containing protein [Tieghemostelium lacteum]|uniref:WD40 repeat-containing protein n=1 Tax=Tieghemostelium lacteum TaxID=361077 RepID=A0A151Z732_TIELA|nr:WD40 repeat-containing protein [Tieghemostelium lacteum]|eukprot:KYQ89594.1 WD40 repeat-containing protein [Tieghemostelium lacteum]
MIQEEQCLLDIKTLDDIVYGEYKSKLIGNTEISDESKLPYDILLERKYFKNLIVGKGKFDKKENLLQSPIPIYIQNIQKIIASKINSVYNWANSFSKEQEDLHQANRNSNINGLRNDSVIKLMKWHPQYKYLAVVNSNDVVYIYNFTSLDQQGVVGSANIGKPISLCFEFQSGVKDLQWKLNYPLTLALASDNGIILWEIDLDDFESLLQNETNRQQQHEYNNRISNTSVINTTMKNGIMKLEPSRTTATVLSYPFFNASTISWSRDGLQIISGCDSYNYIAVWDVATKVPTFIPRHRGSFLLDCNYTGNLALSCCSKTKSFRIYKLSDWTYEGKEWKQISSHQSACWSPNGEYLCIASAEKMMFLQSEQNAMESVGELRYLEKTTPYHVTYHEKNGAIFNQTTVCGHIRKVLWSPDGQRLAVLFFKGTKTEKNESIIALYRVRTSPRFEVSPRGFLKNEGVVPIQNISFMPNYQKGSLLTVHSEYN